MYIDDMIAELEEAIKKAKSLESELDCAISVSSSELSNQLEWILYMAKEVKEEIDK